MMLMDVQQQRLRAVIFENKSEGLCLFALDLALQQTVATHNYLET
jgi:hypothetical protein